MLNPDVICLPAEGSPDRWILYNVFTRTCLGIDHQAFHCLSLPAKDFDGAIPVWFVGWFSHGDGTMADPTRIRRSSEVWGEPKMVSHAQFLDACRKLWLIIDNESAYQKRFARKVTPLDGEHFGNFHDQMGFHLLVEKRLSPTTWWLKQKFSADLKSVRNDNLYGQVQEPFLRNYFHRRLTKDAHALDLGCGIGHFTNMMAETGCDAFGIDPNKDYIEFAQKNAHPSSRFKVSSIGHPGDLSALPTEYFDFVFIQDALLFYFIRVSRNDTQQLRILLDDVRRLLKSGGSVISVEPHPTYYLAPWLGGVGRPFTVVTEHRNRRFSTVPNSATFIKAILRSGFQLTNIEDLYPAEDFDVEQERGTVFSAEFPLWTLLEFLKTAS